MAVTLHCPCGKSFVTSADGRAFPCPRCGDLVGGGPVDPEGVGEAKLDPVARQVAALERIEAHLAALRRMARSTLVAVAALLALAAAAWLASGLGSAIG